MRRFLLGLMEHIFLLGILIGSLLVLFGNQLTAHIARTSTKNQVVKKVSKKELEKEVNSANYNWSEVANSNVLDSLSAKFSSETKPIALVTQPQAKIASTVVAGLDKYQLNLAVGTISPDQKLGEGNYVLVGHHVPKSEWALFSGVYYFAEPNQKIYLTDLNKVYEYTIKDVKFVEETEVHITENDKYLSSENNHTPGTPKITIISCDITGKKRITEYGDLTNIYNFNKDEIPAEAVTGFEKAGDFNWNS